MLFPYLKKKREGSIFEVWNISWPIIISMLSFTAMGVADTLIVGWVGKTELAAVGIATTAIYLVNAFCMGLLESVKILASNAFGAKDQKRLEASLWHGLFLAIPCGIFVISLSFFDELIFRLLGGSKEIQMLAIQYFNIRVLAAPIWYLAFTAKGYLQGKGDTRTPMYVNLVVNVLNIALDIVLVFGLGPIPAMGVKGAALATLIACLVGALIMVYVILVKEGLRPVFVNGLTRKLLALGFPVGVTYALEIGGFTFFTAIMARIGENELAAHQIAIKIISLSFLPGHAIGEAATILTGQYLGAKKVLFARRSFFSSLKIAVAFMGILGLIFLIFPEFLMSLFGSDEEVTKVGIKLLMVAALFQIFDAIAMTAGGALRGAGDTKFTMNISILCSWFIMVPFSYLFAMKMELGAAGAWMALTLQIFVLAFVLILRFYKIKSLSLKGA